MKYNELKQSVQFHIEKDNIAKALSIITEYLDINEKHFSFKNELVTLKNNYNYIEEEYNGGRLINEEFSVRKNLLIKRINTLILTFTGRKYQFFRNYSTKYICGNAAMEIKKEIEKHGRVNELIELNQILDNENEIMQPMIQINGIGGIGKSFLVKYYIHRHKQNYRTIAWITIGENSNFTDALLENRTLQASLNYELRTPDEIYIRHQLAQQNIHSLTETNKKIDIEKQKKVFLKKFNAEQIILRLKTKYQKPGLLVVDCDKQLDAIENMDILRLIDEIRDKWSVVFISRNKLSGINNSISLDGLDNKASFRLYKSTVENAVHSSELNDFFNLVRNHPLAIILAAKNVHENRTAINSILKHYQTQGLRKLNVDTVLKYFLRISELNKYENLILSLFSLIPPKKYSVEALNELRFDKQKIKQKGWIERWLSGEKIIEQNFPATLSKLTAKGWISYKYKHYEIHPLMQEVIQENETGFINDCTVLSDLCTLLYENIDDEMVDGYLNTSPKVFEALEYADFLLSHINKKRITEEFSAFPLSMARTYQAVNDNAKAIKYYEYYVQIKKQQGYSDKGTDLIDIYFTIIDLAEEANEEEIFIKYSPFIDTTIQNNSSDYNYAARIYHRRGSLNIKHGNPKDALSDAKKALSYYTSVKIPEKKEEVLIYNQNIAAIKNNIGCAYEKIGDIHYLKNAKEYVEVAFYKYKELLDRNTDIMAWINCNMGVVEYKLKRYNSAYKYFNEALDIAQNIFVSNSFHFAVIYANLAITYSKLQNKELAFQYIDNAINIIFSDKKSRNSDKLTLMKIKMEIYNDFGDKQGASSMLNDIYATNKNVEKYTYFFNSVMYF